MRLWRNGKRATLRTLFLKKIGGSNPLNRIHSLTLQGWLHDRVKAQMRDNREWLTAINLGLPARNRKEIGDMVACNLSRMTPGQGGVKFGFVPLKVMLRDNGPARTI